MKGAKPSRWDDTEAENVILSGGTGRRISPVGGAYANPRNITPDDLVKGAKIIGAATAIEALVNGTKTLDF